MKSANHEYTIFKQICNLIPVHLVPKFARVFGADKKARTFSPWSHIVAMRHVQIAYSSPHMIGGVFLCLFIVEFVIL